MIKHSINWDVLTPFSPGVSLNAKLLQAVNEEFILPIVQVFFGWKGIAEFAPLDIDKMKTEIEFEREEDFVNNYIYPEIFDDIHKLPNQNKVHHLTRYIITFDADITNEKAGVKYPNSPNVFIQYGEIKLGVHPILYYIWIDLQEVIRFIKTKSGEVKYVAEKKIKRQHIKGLEAKYINTINRRIDEISKEIDSGNLDREAKKILLSQVEMLEKSKEDGFSLQGGSGSLRVNLKWSTIDDLDLHVKLPDGQVIYYSNKEVVSHGKIGTLDVDANAGTPFTSSPQENIYWEEPPTGKFHVSVRLYSKRTQDVILFQVTIFQNDEIGDFGGGRVFSKSVSLEGETVHIVDFEYQIGRSIKFIQ
jgi:hypothetical protein